MPELMPEPMPEPRPHDVVFTTVTNRVATVTINRPEARNALNHEVRTKLRQTMADVDADADVDVVILTGADPAFTAGLDLKELGGGDPDRSGSAISSDSTTPVAQRPFAPLSKPLIGAVNGVAITGGFEIALNCDFLIASERAAFADTHARVGVMPGWGLTVLLAEAVGVRRAREISFTGNFVDAHQAWSMGLVNRVVPHGELLSVCQKVAEDIVGNDVDGVRNLLGTYRSVAETTVAEGWQIEARNGWEFRQRHGFRPDEVERRRQRIVERGRDQLG
jgi:enoyl-CoA hydratase